MNLHMAALVGRALLHVSIQCMAIGPQIAALSDKAVIQPTEANIRKTGRAFED